MAIANTNLSNQIGTNNTARITVLISKSVLIAYSSKELPIDDYIKRHNEGDWGLASEQEKAANNIALKNGDRIISYFCVAGHILAISTQNQKTRVELAENLDSEVA